MSIYYNRKHIYRSSWPTHKIFAFAFCPIMLGLTGLEVFVPKGRIFQQETEKLFLWTWDDIAFCLLGIQMPLELTVQEKGYCICGETDFSYEVEIGLLLPQWK